MSNYRKYKIWKMFDADIELSDANKKYCDDIQDFLNYIDSLSPKYKNRGIIYYDKDIPIICIENYPNIVYCTQKVWTYFEELKTYEDIQSYIGEILSDHLGLEGYIFKYQEI